MRFSTALVTGAHGFVGRNVARRLAEAGVRVTGLGHGAWSGEEEWKSWGISAWHRADVTLEALSVIAEMPDLLVHCAGGGSVGYSIQNPYLDFQNSVSTTAAVLEFARLHAPGARVVLPSSAGVYGVASRMPMTETEAPHPQSPYGTHKLMAEELCASYARNHGLAIAVVRLFSVYGPGLRKQLLWDACSRIAGEENGFFGSGTESRDWIHVSDAAALLVRAGEHASRECPVVNGGTGVETSVRDVLAELFEAFGRKDAPRFSGAPRAGDPAHYVADISRARAWGWQPQVGWREGVRDYVLWFKSGAR